MNLIALETLTAYITLEIQALQVLVAYQIQVKGYNTYCPLAHKINRTLFGCKVVYFRLFLTDLECFADVQQIDLELPIMRETISAYCIIHNENNTLIECASFDRAKTVCDAKGLGYSVICKYWIDGQTVYDDEVYRTSQEVYMTLNNMHKALHMLSRDDQDWYTLTNLISDIQEGYLFINHKPDKLYKVKVYIKAVTFYSTDKPVIVPPSFSMLVLQYLARFEIVCIEMLLFWFCQNYDPNSKVYKDASLLDETIFYHKYERYPVLYGYRHNSEIFTKGMFALTV